MNDKCPNCGSENIYFNGTLCECIKCSYEWCVETPKDIPQKEIKEFLKKQEKKKNNLSGF